MEYVTTLERKKDRLFSFEQALILFLFFLGSMNFVGRYYYCFFFAFALFLLFFQRIRVDGSILALLALSLNLLLFADLDSLITTMIKPFLYPMAYLLGRGFWGLIRSKKEDEKRTT